MSRIDKYLWAVRVFKTRNEATVACNGGKVKVAGVNCKPSKAVKEGEIIEIRKGPAVLSYRVIIADLESRVGAQLVPQYAENITPDSELDKLHAPVQTIQFKRDRGTGRPTKKDRRLLDSLISEMEEDE